MNDQRSPFDLLFAQLTQGMTARDTSASGQKRSTPITNELGRQKDAAQTQADRLVWVARDVAIRERPFLLPQDNSQNDQVTTFDVAIYGSSFARVLDLHAWMAGVIDNLIGPPMGCAPSDDTAPATLTGTVDLATLVYPFAGLAGLSLQVTLPLSRSLAFADSYADPVAIAVGINVAARAAKLDILASLTWGDDGARFLVLTMPQDALDPRAHTLTIDPDAASSACSVLGFSAGDGNITAATTPASSPYRPGYLIGPSSKPVSGGDLDSSGWGMTVPVELRRPTISTHYLLGMIQSTPFDVFADDDLAISNPGET